MRRESASDEDGPGGANGYQQCNHDQHDGDEVGQRKLNECRSCSCAALSCVPRGHEAMPSRVLWRGQAGGSGVGAVPRDACRCPGRVALRQSRGMRRCQARPRAAGWRWTRGAFVPWPGAWPVPSKCQGRPVPRRRRGRESRWPPAGQMSRRLAAACQRRRSRARSRRRSPLQEGAGEDGRSSRRVLKCHGDCAGPVRQCGLRSLERLRKVESCMERRG